MLIRLGEVEVVEKSIAKASQNDSYPKFCKMQKKKQKQKKKTLSLRLLMSPGIQLSCSYLLTFT